MIDNVDLRLSALFEESDSPADPDFAARVIALAAYDARVIGARRAAVTVAWREGLGLLAVLVCFCLLAVRSPGEPIGPGEFLPLGSPAMLGLALLGLWALVASHNRPVARDC